MPEQSSSLPSPKEENPEQKQLYWEPWVQSYENINPKISKRAYCEQHQLHYTKFLHWHRKLLSAKSSQTPKMIPVKVKSVSSVTNSTEPLGTLHALNGVVLVLQNAKAFAMVLDRLL